MSDMDHNPLIVRKQQVFDQFRILRVEPGKHLVINDNTLGKRQTSGQADPSLFPSGNLQGFVADPGIQRIAVCCKKLIQLYFADNSKQFFIRTVPLQIKITPDRIVENINLLRHQQIVNSQRQQKNKDDQKTHPVAT